LFFRLTILFLLYKQKKIVSNTQEESKMVKINREMTAISRKDPSAPTKWAYENGHIGNHVYDWGCGQGADVRWLEDQGHQVSSYDPHFFPDNDPLYADFSDVDTIMCHYVLNVVPTKKERRGILLHIASKGVDTVVISVRSDVAKNAEKKGWKPHNDGYLVPKNGKFTFQKNYTLDEVKAMQELFGDIIAIRNKSGGITAVFKK
jgi:ATP adenylyltransferase